MKCIIFQVNLNKCKQAQLNLNTDLDRAGTFMALVQEPYFGINYMSLVNKQITCIPANRKGQPRAAIFASSNQAISEIAELTSRDTAAGILKIEGKNTLIVSMYMDILNQDMLNQLDTVLQFVKRKRLALFIGVDCNAHHTAWGNQDNPRGKELFEYLVQNQLELHNVGRTPTFDCATGTSIIDITPSYDLRQAISSWQVDMNENFSDHNTIKFKLESQTVEMPPHNKWATTDWKTFQRELSPLLLEIPSRIGPYQLDRMVDKLYKVLLKALDKHCPLIPGSLFTGSNPWFNNKLKQDRKQVFAQYKVYKAHPSNADIKARYTTLVKQYKRNCKQARTENKRLKDIAIDDAAEMSRYMQNHVGNKLYQPIGSLKIPNGDSDPGLDTLRTLANTHYPDHTIKKEPIRPNIKHCTADINKKYKDWVNVDRLMQVFRYFKSKKSPGPD